MYNYAPSLSRRLLSRECVVGHLLGSSLYTLGHLHRCGLDLSRQSMAMDIPFIVLLYLVSSQSVLY